MIGMRLVAACVRRSLISDRPDASGNFQVRTVPDGDFYVKVTNSGYATQLLGPYTFNHAIVNGLFDKQTRSSAATLSVVKEDGHGCAFHRCIEIAIGKLLVALDVLRSTRP